MTNADDVTEGLARELYIADNWGREDREREWDDLLKPPPVYERYRKIARAILAGPTVRELQAGAWDEAMRAFAEGVSNTYPEDVFLPVSSEHHAAINAHLAAGGFTRDGISADMMRRAGAMALRCASPDTDYPIAVNPYREAGE